MSNIESVLEAGATRIAVSSAIVHAEKPREARGNSRACWNDQTKMVATLNEEDRDQRVDRLIFRRLRFAAYSPGKPTTRVGVPLDAEAGRGSSAWTILALRSSKWKRVVSSLICF